MYYQVLIHINDQGGTIISSSGTRTLNADAIDNMVVKIQDLGHIFLHLVGSLVGILRWTNEQSVLIVLSGVWRRATALAGD